MRDWLCEKYPADRYHLPLKTGRLVGVVSGLWMMHKLQDLMYLDTELVEAAIKICHGRRQEVKPELVNELIGHFVLDRNGTMDEVMRDGVLSACIKAEGKVMVVNPFKLERAQDKLLVDRIERDFQKDRRQMGLDEYGNLHG